jgi:gas vesicle protein
MENNNGSRKKGALAFSFTAGGLLGAMVGLLFAPWQGRQARGKLKELGEEVKEKSIRFSNNWKEKTAEFLEKRKSMAPAEKDLLSAGRDPGQDEAGIEKEISMTPEGA